jgi:ribonucleoside-diphosphate reductase alpha chain
MGTKRLGDCPSLPIGRLEGAGFDRSLLSSIEGRLGDVFDLRSAFTPSILGEEFCIEKLGMTQSQVENPFFDTLGFIGLTGQEIDAANDYIFGYNTIEGAPGLKDEHLAVFDCATPCGKYGKRSIAWDAHVKMMASAQPFISGAISKTINMPSDASIEDVKEAYNLSHATMNKACAVYRDGSKLSQPLMSQLVDSIELEENEEDSVVEKMVEEAVSALPLPEPVAIPVAEALVENYIASRRALPDNKRGANIKARVGGHSVRLITGEYADGKLGEIFLLTSKEGAAWRALLSQFAIAVSIGLQHGVPIDAFVKSFTFTKFEPSGIIEGGSGRVKMSSSIIDWVFRELAIEYAGRKDLAHIPLEEEDLDPFSISKPEVTEQGLSRNQGEKRDVQMTLEATTRRAAKERGFTGDICDDCGGSQMVRNGTCLKCNECGSTTGCS